MGKQKLNPKILLKLKKNFPDRKENAIQARLSQLSSQHGVTLNAAAEIMARKDGFHVWGLLDEKDKECFREKEVQVIKVKRSNRNNINEVKRNYTSEFLSEANKNIRAYVDIYVIENVLRKIIFETFGKEKKWWKEDFVSKDVFNHAEEIRIAESKHPWVKKRGDHPLYYVGLEELKKIITKHWETNFKWIGNKEKFFPWVDELIPIRNMVAHNVPLEKEEINMAAIKSKWLINIINNQNDDTNKTA